MRSICKVDGCEDFVVGQGLCNKHYLRKRRGISEKYKKRLQINEKCFHGDLGEYESYYIGVIQTDGWLFPRPDNRQMSIGLKMCDEDVVRGFAEFVNLPHIVRMKDKPNRAKYWTMSFSSDVIANRLIELGVTPKKTYGEEYPYGVEFRHYLRGFLDGDGTIQKNGRAGFYLTGTECLKEIEKRLDNLNFDFNSIPTYSNGKDIQQYNLYLKGGKKGYKKFLDWLYKDANVYMNRKYNKYRDIFYK